MADKFSRISVVEGDVLYATTASSTKSIESLEDNIDDKLLTFLGEDNTGTSTSSTSETEIGEVIVSANTARNRIIILASVESNAGNALVTAVFRIRTGISSTATNNTTRESINLLVVNTATSGGFLLATIISSDETFTSDFFVHLTVIHSGAGIGTSTCNRIIVLGQ